MGSWEHCKVIFKYFGCLEVDEEALIWELWTVSISAGTEIGQRAMPAFRFVPSTFWFKEKHKFFFIISWILLEHEHIYSRFSTVCYVNKFSSCNQQLNSSASQGLAQHFHLFKDPFHHLSGMIKKLAERNSTCTKLWEATKTTVHWRFLKKCSSTTDNSNRCLNCLESCLRAILSTP